MNQKELDENIEELDKRVDRLRALYEQYFLGIERIEPQVLRKDVERRLYVLRREKIRNTAVRFKFQQVLQRYTTYQTYWQRVARQIEEGTFRRDVLKTRARLIAQRDEKRRQRLAAQGRLPAGAADDGIDVDVDVDVDEAEDYGDAALAATAGDLGLPADDGGADDLPAEKTEPRIQVHELALEVSALSKVAEEIDDAGEAPQLTFGAPRRPTPEVPTRKGPPSRPSGSPGPAALGRIALKRVLATPARGGDEATTLPVAVEPYVPSGLEPATPPPPRRPSSPPAGARALGEPLGGPPRPGSPAVPTRPISPPSPAPWTPPPPDAQPPAAVTPRPGKPSAPPPGAIPLADPLPAPRRPPPSPPAAIAARTPTDDARPGPASPMAHWPSAVRSVAPPPAKAPASGRPPPPPPAAAFDSTTGQRPLRVPVSEAPTEQKAVRPPPVPPAAASFESPTGQRPVRVPAPEAPTAPTPVRPPQPSTSAGPSGETDLRSLFLKRTKTASSPPPPPSGPPPAPAPTKRKSRHSIAKPDLPVPPPRAAAKAPSPHAGGPSISDDRMRAIYDRYAAERRRNNEGEVHFDTVAKSIRDMLPKLEEKAQGKKVDFEVVVKDGKTVLKPVAK